MTKLKRRTISILEQTRRVKDDDAFVPKIDEEVTNLRSLDSGVIEIIYSVIEPK